MQLMWTNVVFSRIALLSCFCAEIQLSGKIPENIPKILFSQEIHGARRRGAGDPGVGQTKPKRGPGLATPGLCLVMSTHASILVHSVGPPSAEVCRTTASFP